MSSGIQRDEGAVMARWPHALPPTIAALTMGGVWEQITIGMSGASVYRVAWPDALSQRAVYLKIAPPTQRAELLDEQARIDWLAHAAPDIGAPRALAYAVAGDFAYLALTRVAGLMACDAALADDKPLVARLLGEGMRQLHAVDAARCPFDRRLERTLAEAAQRLAAGQVDVDDFDDPERNPTELLAWLQTHIPDHEDLAFTHGDYCLPNVLIDPAARQISGYIDWGRAGVADRYQDLALAARSLGYNIGSGWDAPLWEAYGLPQPDEEKLTFYRLLDEFF
jgi:aminoglycoside phosphotransferase